jgi:hypothetical protein
LQRSVTYWYRQYRTSGAQAAEQRLPGTGTSTRYRYVGYWTVPGTVTFSVLCGESVISLS